MEPLRVATTHKELMTGIDNVIIEELPKEIRAIWQLVEVSDFLVIEDIRKEDPRASIAVGVALVIGVPIVVKTDDPIFEGAAWEVSSDIWQGALEQMIAGRNEIYYDLIDYAAMEQTRDAVNELCRIAES